MNSAFIRNYFPSLSPDEILFENAGGTQVPGTVIERTAEFYRKTNVQPGYPYQKSKNSSRILEEAHKTAGRFIGAEDPGTVILGPSATALNRLMGTALRERFKPGDEVIVTVADHEANINPWVYLERFGIKVKIWNIDPETFELNPRDLQDLLTPRTVLAAFPHVSNVLGSVNDITELTKIVHDSGAMAYVDGVASVPHVPVDVASSGVDFFVYSLYKTFGPHMAALYARPEILEFMEGANHFFLQDKIPKKFELGTPNLEGCAAILGVEDYFRRLARNVTGESGSEDNPFLPVMEEIKEHEKTLTDRLLNGLAGDPRIRIIGFSQNGCPDRRVPVVSFCVKDVRPADLAEKLARQGIAAGHGHFYAYRLIEFLGLMEKGGVLRASLVHYNTTEEVDRFLEVLFNIIG